MTAHLSFSAAAYAFSLPEQQALATLRTQGIKLRDTASFGLTGHVRISVQPPAAQHALHSAWQYIIGKSE